MKELIKLEQAVGKILTRIEYSCDYLLMEFDHGPWCINSTSPEYTTYSNVLNKKQLFDALPKYELINIGLMDEVEWEVFNDSVRRLQEQQEREQYERLRQKFSQ